jgi:ribosomal protein S18 acetylase RimI-like enzyme
MKRDLQIRPVARTEWDAAASCLFGSLPVEQRRLVADLDRDTSQAEGLLGAYENKKLVAVCRLQFQPGRAGHLWRPVLISASRPTNEPTDRSISESCGQLLQEVVRLAERRQLALVQVLLPADVGADAALLRAAGFTHVADLLYLVAMPNTFPTEPPSTSVSLAPFDETNHTKLEKIVEKTYVGTLDCPSLNNSREIADVLAGYRGIGASGNSLWWIVQSKNRDVGCVLVAEHTPQLWELVYLGIEPAMRGQGLGLEATRAVQHIALKHGVERLVLAVDSANNPAIDLYAKAGFLAWDRQSVFVWRPM